MTDPKPTHGGARPGAGRPAAGPDGHVRSVVVRVPATPGERETWRQQAQADGVSLAEWVRRRCARGRKRR